MALCLHTVEIVSTYSHRSNTTQDIPNPSLPLEQLLNFSSNRTSHFHSPYSPFSSDHTATSHPMTISKFSPVIAHPYHRHHSPISLSSLPPDPDIPSQKGNQVLIYIQPPPKHSAPPSPLLTAPHRPTPTSSPPPPSPSPSSTLALTICTHARTSRQANCNPSRLESRQSRG